MTYGDFCCGTPAYVCAQPSWRRTVVPGACCSEVADRAGSQRQVTVHGIEVCELPGVLESGQ